MMYAIKAMRVTITDFRKNLFQIMDRVANGELVEVLHKGNTIRLTLHAQPRSKMSRIVKRDTLLVSPDELETARRELQDEMNAEMEKDWSNI
jgi:antitoxin (DNA-binding transcriptional repressor) of toxin-antitoxin stability system